MTLSLLIEQYIYSEKQTSLDDVARRFGIARTRCREEVERLEPFGVELTRDGRVAAIAEAA